MSDLSSLSSLLGSVLPGHDQVARLIRLHTPLGPDVLLAEDLNLWESLVPQAGPGVAALAGRLGRGGTAPWAPAGADSAAFVHGPALGGMRLVLHALCADATLDARALVGQPALVELLCQDSASELRPWHGHIASAAWLGADGGLARLRLVIEPWLAWLGQGRDARTHQRLTVPHLVDEVFSRRSGQLLPDGSNLQPAWRWALADDSVYPERSLTVQDHESDLAFVLRLLHEEGLVAWWEHAGDPASPALGSHTLVIADHAGALAANRQASVRFAASEHTLGEDSLTSLADARRVAPNRVDLTSRDHRSGGASAQAHRPVSAPVCDAPAAANNALVDHPGAYAYPTLEQGRRLARVHADALQAASQRGLARGPWRRAEAGTWFTLNEHPRHGGPDDEPGEFVILAAQHRARNNLSADERARAWALDQILAQAQSGDAATEGALNGEPSRHPDARAEQEQRLHDAALLLQPLAAPLRAAADAVPDLFAEHAADHFGLPDVRLQVEPTAPAAQSAIVVGDSAPVHTDRDGRVRIQKHWQRGAEGSHRLGHPDGSNDAPAAAASHPWVRVGQVLAGRNYGAVFTPRVGQEAMFTHLGNNADRPLVLGALYNGRGQPDAQGNQVAGGAAGASGNAPGWFPGAARAGELEGHAHDAVLSGLRSQALASSGSGQGGHNQLVFDDSPGQQRVELASTQADTRLQLGHLLHQGGNQRLNPRGHGLALDSTAHGALRAGAGLLVSAHGRAPSTQLGQQLDSREPQQLLQAAQDLQQSLADTAQHHHTRLDAEPAVAGGSVDKLAAQLPVQRGLHGLQTSLHGTASFGGSGSQGGDGFTTTEPGPDGSVAIGGGHGTVAAWGQPELVFAAPAGIGLATPAHAVLTAGSHLSTTASQDIHSIAQGHHALAVKSGIALFTCGQANNPGKPNTETGIALHAATGSVHVSLNSGAANLAADQAVELVSTQGNLAVLSPESIVFAAAGAAIEIQGGAVNLKAPSSIEVHAGMKVWAGGANASAPPPVLLAAASLALPDTHSARLDVHDFFVQHRFENVRYSARLADGRFLSGTLDGHGRTRPVYANEAQPLQVLVGTSKPEWDLIFDYDDAGL